VLRAETLVQCVLTGVCDAVSLLVSCSGELEAARELYLEAIGVEADCVEAIFNLGLCNKALQQYGDALQVGSANELCAPVAWI